MSSSSLRAVRPDTSDEGAPAREARELVEQLERFAFQRERVLALLDLRAAAQARHIARQLCTVAPFVRLGLDEELREAAALELAELVAQARVCLGERPASKPPATGPVARSERRAAPRADDQKSAIRSRRDLRRDPTQDAAPSRVGALVDRVTRDERSRIPTEAESTSLRGRPTEPEPRVVDVPIESGVRRAGDAHAEEDDDAARAWRCLLGGGSSRSLPAVAASRSVVTLTPSNRRRDPR